uniref:sugar phosphate exchanger 3-like n=1 Tax=Styela clava TaxID=7725 RepID=UPI001939EBEE|nr:sugar phosphate exchanger 3-like [Styela clava]
MWSHHQIVAFVLTYCVYTIFHASRKAYSDSKDSFSKEWTPLSCNLSWPCPRPEEIWEDRQLFSSYASAEPFLGLLDSLFLVSYAIGMYFTSFLADRVELRKALAIAMFLSGILLFCFGVLTQILHFYNKGFYISLWILQGIIQSVGWPTCVAVVGNWFGKSGRGLVFGIWASCASVGNVIGNVITSSVINYGYEYAFLTISVMMLGGGLVVVFGLVNSPLEVGLPPPVETESLDRRTLDDEDSQPLEDDSNSEDDMNVPTNAILETVDKDNALTNTTLENENTEIVMLSNNHQKESQPLSFLNALFLPGVIPYSLSFACLKLVNYAFLFWLPYYLTNHFQWDDSLASSVSTWYDVGGIAGGIIAGVLSDVFKTRSLVLFFMLLGSPFALWGYKSSPNDVVINSILMSIVGFLINGVSNILSSAIAVDIAKREAVGEHSLATVTGIIDGTGSLGAAIGQYLVAVIQSNYGWNWVFNLFIISNVTSLICLFPIFYNDFVKHSACANRLFERLLSFRSSYRRIDEN